ncbi:MAG: response regulator transcription factor, partial [Sphingobacteriales bacterium]
MRVLIADDHTVVRRGLKQILLEGFPTAQIEEVPDAEELIKRVMQAEWDVIISDLSMPGRSGLEALQQIKQVQPKLPVLILSIHPEEQYAIRVLKAGASGYLSKDSAPDELVTAVQRVLLGKKYITDMLVRDNTVEHIFDQVRRFSLLPTVFEEFKLDSIFIQKRLPEWYLGHFNTISCATSGGNTYYYLSQNFSCIPSGILAVELERVTKGLVANFGIDELGNGELEGEELKSDSWQGREWRNG